MAQEQYSEQLFTKARERIMPYLVGKQVDEIEQEILDIVQALDGRKPNGKIVRNFSDWDLDSLLSAQGRLALLRVNLGVLSSEAKSRTNYSARYKIYQTSKQWQPFKHKIEKEFHRLNQKVLKGDIEAALVEAFWETTQKEVFLQEVSDRLESLFDSTNQVLTAIKYKINQLNKEQAEARHYDDGSRIRGR